MQGGSPLQPIFHPASTKHTHTLRQHTLFGSGSCRVNTNTWGEGVEDGGGTREDCGLRVVIRSAQGAPAWVLRFCATKAGRAFLSPDPEAQPGVSPMPSTNGEGLGRSLGCAHHSAWDPSPALKMAPGRCLPSDCGHPGSGARAGRGQRSGRA